jgi:hypothetical protein
MSRIYRIVFASAALVVVIAVACARVTPDQQDEAMRARRDASSLKPADEDYFRGMDGGVALTAAEIRGRNTWNVWTAGNDRFWDVMSVRSAGTLDFLKTLSSHPSLKFSRDNRWEYLGLLNEPCFQKATRGDPKKFGLWLDTRDPGCEPDPFENEQKYPGVRIGSRGRDLHIASDDRHRDWPRTLPVGSYYGYATGVLGLRLFPNPEFDEAAARAWDPDRYYTDSSYYDSATLVKPFRVGMSCGFCHIGPNPLRPPADPEHPAFENLSSYVGAQYFWVDRIFSFRGDESSFMFQLFHTSRPGTLDTSLVATDNINNPRAMNAVYNLGARLGIATRLGEERLAGGGLHNRQFSDFDLSAPPADTLKLIGALYKAPGTVRTPHVLKDGADSVGALGALNRVFVNIGEFSEEWLLHVNPLVGGKRPSPISIEQSRRNSSYWQATESQTPDVALFFLKAALPHHLKDAPGGSGYLISGGDALQRGKIVFAETCARCHSSKLPEFPRDVEPLGSCAGPDYLNCFKRYWAWTKTADFKAKMRAIVLADDFLADNFLSTDLRVPVTLLETNACSPFAANAIRDHIWDNFSSESYKTLPSVGEITWYHPDTGAARTFSAPAGGRGYTRPPSLVSLWSTAPFLLNNSVGDLDPRYPRSRYRENGTGQPTPPPGIADRMRSFDDAIEKLLWPEKRDKDTVLGEKLRAEADGSLPLPSLIDRTTATSYIHVPMGYVPDELRALAGFGRALFPFLQGAGGEVEIGPIPKGTPVNLIANLRLLSESANPADRAGHTRRVLDLLRRVIRVLGSLPPRAADEQARAAFAPLVDQFLDISTCPDLIVNRGHYFGTRYQTHEPPLSDSDKRALIEFLKTF